MTKEIIGDACAFIKGVAGAKNRYPRIGIAMREGDRISIKLDTLPIDKAWDGWINIFPREPTPAPLQSTSPYAPRNPDFLDDEIPF